MDPRRAAVLLGLAANAAAPLDVLLRLVAHPAAAERMALTRAPVPDELAERLLATGNRTVARLLYSERKSSPAVLQRIDEALGVRDHSRTSLEQVVDRGGSVSLGDLEGYAGPGGLAALAVHPNPLVRKVVARNWTAMPADTRRALLTDPVAGVRREAAGHPNTLTDLHAALLADEVTCPAAARYATLTPDSARGLATSDFSVLRRAVAENPTLPSDLRDLLAQDPDPGVRGVVALRQDTPDDLRRALHQQPVDPRAAKAMAGVDLGWLRALPLRERLAHLDSPVEHLRRAVAESPDLPPDAAAHLDADPDFEVRRIAATRAGAPPDVLTRFVLDHGARGRWARLLLHPNFPPEGFIALADHPAVDRRAIAPLGEDLPVDVLVRLARDPEPVVRRAAAGHPRIPPAVLEVLLADDEHAVVEAAASSPALSRSVMLRLVDEAGW